MNSLAFDKKCLNVLITKEKFRFHLDEMAITLTARNIDSNPGHSRTLVTFQCNINSESEIEIAAALAYIKAGLSAGGYSRKTIDMPSVFNNNNRFWLYKPVRTVVYNHIIDKIDEKFEDYLDEEGVLMWDNLEKDGLTGIWNPEEFMFCDHSALININDFEDKRFDTENIIIYVRYKQIAKAMNKYIEHLRSLLFGSELINNKEFRVDNILLSNKNKIEFKGLEEFDPVDYDIDTIKSEIEKEIKSVRK